MGNGAYFTKDTFRFLEELGQNNHREWFEAQRERYEASARQPMLRFITDLGPRLAKAAPRYQVDPRPSGGSMLRIHRDVRFSKDKSPYKTNLAAHFVHRDGADGGSPGLYLHIAPGDCASGAGVWRPEPVALKAIRDAIAAAPDEWRRVTGSQKLGSACGMMGEKLARPPKGYDPAHPLIEELKRKDFAVRIELTMKQVIAPDFLDTFVDHCARLGPFLGFLSGALGLPR